MIYLWAFSYFQTIMASRDKQQLYDDVKSRHEDIIRLEANINELHDMFNDMALLVESQVGEAYF